MTLQDKLDEISSHQVKCSYSMAARKSACIMYDWTMKKVEDWLRANAYKYVVNTTPSYPDAPFSAIVGGGLFTDLRKAIEDE